MYVVECCSSFRVKKFCLKQFYCFNIISTGCSYFICDSTTDNWFCFFYFVVLNELVSMLIYKELKTFYCRYYKYSLILLLLTTFFSIRTSPKFGKINKYELKLNNICKFPEDAPNWGEIHVSKNNRRKKQEQGKQY